MASDVEQLSPAQTMTRRVIDGFVELIILSKEQEYIDSEKED